MEKIISNENINEAKLNNAKNIILNLQKDMEKYTQKGCGPFLAAIYDDKNNLIAKCANSVINENCSNNHAEVNAIKLAQEKLKTHDLSKYNLKLYVTAEPCMMCIGAIMWSGIKEVYFGAYDNLYGAFGSKLNMPKFFNSNIKIKGGICEDTCSDLLKNFWRKNG